MNNTRVVITGLGALSPLGNNVPTNWANALKGKSGASRITRFDPSEFKVQFACEVKDYNPADKLDRKEIKKTDLFTQYALYASSEAIEDAGLDINACETPYDIGVIWGSGQGGMDTFEEEVKYFSQNNGKPRFSPFFIPKLITNMASGMISMKHGFMGINYTAVSACATSNTAIMDAFNYIRMGKAKAIITGGSESPITEASIGGFSAMKAMSTRNDQPQAASRPFDVDRDGFVMGEGAAALVLEEYTHAKKRGANIYAEVVGAGMTADAYHLTATHPEGEGAYHAMKFAMDEAKINIQDIDYLNAHATSTPVGDVSELKAVLRHVKNNDGFYITATKSMTGHLLGGAGAIEAILSIKSLNDGVIPPTINLDNLDPKVPANIRVVNKALEKDINLVMSNTFGFGGHNSTVIFKKFV
ncbi:MAG TPA: beta-ketoacyl-[acyl-carrier-protein] synthase II [Microscillaceae bacterium]|nr:beta-ketoacyl-[acyl-carrier-protein] synthase II [Microscillaceae bacterium]